MNLTKELKLSVRSMVDLSASTNPFGTLGAGYLPISPAADFIPLDNQGGILDLLGNLTDIAPRWIGLSTPQKQYWAYLYCSPLAAVIDKLAEADTNGILQFVNPDGTIRKTESINKSPKLLRIKNLLSKPNPLQTWQEFNSEQIVLCKIFGYCPVWAIRPKGMDKSFTKYLWNLSPYYARPTLDYEYDMMSDSNPLQYWSFNMYGRSYGLIQPEDVILVKDGYTSSINPGTGLPISKIEGLEFFISNICAAMEADNVLLKKKGPLGIFSYDPKPDMAGWTPMGTKDKDDLQSDLKNYGLTIGQLQYVISKIPIKWNSMSYNVSELMTKETVRQSIDGICDRFGYPAELMSGKNATYENRTSAEKFLYQTNVIPFSLRRMAKYAEWFELDDTKLALSYQHLPVLQEDIMHAGQAGKAQSEGLDLDWKNGLITWNEYRIELGWDEVPEGNIYYPEWAKQNHIDLNPPKPAGITVNNKTAKNKSASPLKAVK